MNMRDIRKKIASSILCMVLALAMIVPSAFSFDAYGLDDQAGSASKTVAAAKLDTATELTINGSNFAFSQSVITNEFLDYDRFTDTLKGSTLINQGSAKSPGCIMRRGWVAEL